LLWQICAGTKVSDIENVDRAPDISFQKDGASDTPTYRDIEIIWDAKYRKNSMDRITHPELSAFAIWIDLLNLRNPSHIRFNSLSSLAANCLITNGQVSTEPDRVLNKYRLKEVSSFYPGKTFGTRP